MNKKSKIKKSKIKKSKKTGDNIAATLGGILGFGAGIFGLAGKYRAWREDTAAQILAGFVTLSAVPVNDGLISLAVEVTDKLYAELCRTEKAKLEKIAIEANATKLAAAPPVNTSTAPIATA